MKCLGLLGAGKPNGIAHYTRRIVDEVHHRFGAHYPINVLTLGLHTSIPTDCATVDGETRLRQAITALAEFGAEAVMLCSGSLASDDKRIENMPLLPAITDVTAMTLSRVRISRVGLMGLHNINEEAVWRVQLTTAHVTDVFVPTGRDREHLSNIATTELDHGLINESSRADIVRIAYSLRQAGARAVVVTTPEICAALAEAPPVLPVFDAVELHALAAVDWACPASGDTVSQPTRL